MPSPAPPAVPGRADGAPIARRGLLAGLAAAALLPRPAALAHSHARPVTFLTWTIALDQLRAHIADLHRATGLRVLHQHLPWGSYRTGLAARLGGSTPVDVAWMSDAWLAEFVAAGRLAPIDGIAALVEPFAEMLPFCPPQMTLGGQRYGLPYYTDCMMLLCNVTALRRAGLDQVPATWEELASQCRHIAACGGPPLPLVLPLADSPWLAEVLHAMAFAFGTGFVDARLEAVRGAAARPLAAMLGFLRDAVAPGGIASRAGLGQEEDDSFQDFADGDHAFALLPGYRLLQLNDPARSPNAGAFRAVLMPNGAGATGHETCGWVRFHVMSAAAAADAERRENATAVLRAFGARAWDGELRLQRRLLTELGLPACYRFGDGSDPAMTSFLARATGGVEVVHEQRSRQRAKPVQAPWFGAWQAATAPLWRDAIAARLDIAAAIEAGADAWDRLRPPAERQK